MRIFKAILCGALLLAWPSLLQAQAKSGQAAPESLRNFVQGFYDWYVPVALKDNSVPAWDIALKHSSSLFSLELVRALKRDSAAEGRAAGEIVGLDFDPFLNSQDPSEHYEVGKITQRGGSYWAEVHGVRSGKKSEKPDVVAEAMSRSGRWQFVNFYYEMGPNSKNGDLLSLLKTLRSERRKSRE